MDLSPPQTPATRHLLAAIARREAELERSGNAHMAGPEIERYLSTFREALNLNCESTRYSDLAVGFNWCCAFVYYCCREAGFQFPPKPVASYRYTLAAVPAWHHWAISVGMFQPGTTGRPQIGDIVLYNGVFDGQSLDHIGIVVDVAECEVLSAEGNKSNRTGLFTRAFSSIEGYVRLPESMANHPSPEIEILRAAYAAFNARDIDAALALMTPNVAWPRAFKGGFVRGHEEVRAYWTEQWSEIDPRVEPVAFQVQEGEGILVEVQQMVRDLQGAVLADGNVGHRFHFDGGLIAGMEVELLPTV